MTPSVHDHTPTIEASPACRFCEVAKREPALTPADGLVLIPSAGSLVPGWLLLLPVEHVVNLAELPAAEHGTFAAAAAQATGRLVAATGSAVQFEHGPAGHGRSAGCGVDHAHLHLVPLSMEMRASVRGLGHIEDSLEWRQSEWPWSAVRRPGMDYLFVRESDGTGWIAEAETIPSQVFRRAIARLLGHEHWDWKDPHTKDERAGTYAMLAGDAVLGNGTH